jgi:DNA repair exonuclease SbcCD nuclease subunit
MSIKNLTVAHISDTHIGYEAYRVLSPKGNNLRGEDIARAFALSVNQIIEQDPPLVIHSGDIADRPGLQIRQIIFIKQQLEKLAGIRSDGTRRQVVVISGNHDQPSSRKEACFLELFRGVPGIHIVTNEYSKITFDKIEDNMSLELEDVVVHTLPHDVLKIVNFSEVTPVPGKINILTSHGVAGGSELYVKSLGREFAIPTEVLGRDWEYVALGHWHKQGPVSIVGRSISGKDQDRCKVWYAGSTENMGFGDLRDNGEKRGWLLVEIAKNELPLVHRKYVSIRNIIRFPDIEAENLSSTEITNAIIANIENSNHEGAVLGQVVREVNRDSWAMLEIKNIFDAAKKAIHIEITPKFKKMTYESFKDAASNSIEDLLTESATILLEESSRKGAINLALELINESRRKGMSRDDNKDTIVESNVSKDEATEKGNIDA